MKTALYPCIFTRFNTGTAEIPLIKTKIYGTSSIRFRAAKLWNSLPVKFRENNSFNHFRNPAFCSRLFTRSWARPTVNIRARNKAQPVVLSFSTGEWICLVCPHSRPITKINIQNHSQISPLISFPFLVSSLSYHIGFCANHSHST